MLLSFGGGNASTVTWGQYRTFHRGTWEHGGSCAAKEGQGQVTGTSRHSQSSTRPPPLPWARACVSGHQS